MKKRGSLRALLFPPKCVFCGTLLPMRTPEDAAICAACKQKLPYTMNLPTCKRCGKPVEENEVYCAVCRKTGKRVIQKFCVPYLYEKQVKRSLLRFKRVSARGYAKVYTKDMLAVLQYRCPKAEFDAVVSVPPRIRRLRKTGYDQSAQLARTLARRMGVAYLPSVLRQKENRKKQSGLTLQERWENADGNFCVRKKKKVAGKTVLLVDDICTSGATLYHTASALKAAGAKAVYCITAAVTEKS